MPTNFLKRISNFRRKGKDPKFNPNFEVRKTKPDPIVLDSIIKNVAREKVLTKERIFEIEKSIEHSGLSYNEKEKFRERLRNAVSIARNLK
jgi:hypothetical protein